MNPFQDEYAEQEFAFYNLREPYEKDGIRVAMNPLRGRCDDYLNKNLRLTGREVPVLFIDNQLWMSITYMEIQSMYLPIQRATGLVATAGLGLGYFTLRAAAKSEVSTVDVYEKDRRIIDFFNATFKDREGFDKIHIIEGDAREMMRSKDYDFCFVDIYEHLLPSEIVEDINLFEWQNCLGLYHFWGWERVLVDAIFQGEEPELMDDENEYIQQWMAATFKIGERTHYFHDMYQPLHTRHYNLSVLEAMGRL